MATKRRDRPIRHYRSDFAPYRGASGYLEVYFLAEVDELHQVRRQASPFYVTLHDAIIAWTMRRDRKLRLVQRRVFDEVVA